MSETDIVERLRNPEGKTAEQYALDREAAAEIERLEAERVAVWREVEPLVTQQAITVMHMGKEKPPGNFVQAVSAAVFNSDKERTALRNRATAAATKAGRGVVVSRADARSTFDAIVNDDGYPMGSFVKWLRSLGVTVEDSCG